MSFQNHSAAFLAAILSGALLTSGNALAADLPVKAPVRAPVVAPAYNWTGFYIGAHVGGGWTDSDWVHVQCNCGGGADMGGPGAHVASADGSGLLGGVQVGFNYQFAPNWLIGVEGQFSWTGIDGEHVWTGGNGDPHTASFDIGWIATLGPRLGYVYGGGFIFVKGGVAWADIDYDHTHLMQAGPTLHAVSSSETRTGWFIGAGLEHALWNQDSWKIEYNFVDLGSKELTLTGNCCSVVFNVDQQIHIVKAGINFRFGGGPVAARY
jgi:outer membrane immunogenic protein